MIDDFYQQFEDEFRGTRETIRERLTLYLPFIAPLFSSENPDEKIVDLGCGRGEWLELLQEKGFPAYGVELNKGQISFCRQLNLEVEEANAITWISNLPNESLSVISAFHLVEHLEFEDVRKLVSEALRVLKPGGLLIMETPNPENLSVGTNTFYLDPTHKKPIPHELLSFVPKYYGYERTNVIRKNGSKISDMTGNIGLTDVIFTVGRDYAVLAQKGGRPLITKELEPLFENEDCLGLHRMSRMYDDIQKEQAGQIQK